MLYVLLGANGDICALLPWLKTESERLRRPVPLLVAKDYAPLLEGVSYVSPTIWPGTFVQLTAALRFLKSDIPDLPVKVLQPISRIEDRFFPSFVHEMWYQAGALAKWNKLPLEFDRRDQARESALVRKIYKDKPMILVAPKGQSSPFRWHKELLALIRKEFSETHQIIDLSKVKAHRFFDLLGLYDQAAALVTIDTGHVHLSRASAVPTLVIARDYPQLWDGVPHEPRFKFYCRYAAWYKQRNAMIRALRDVVDSTPADQPFTINPYPNGYNPAICAGELTTCRVHPSRDWKTKIMANGQPIKAKIPASYSQEDMRLFLHNGKLMASCTLAKPHGKKGAKCVTVFGEMKKRGDSWEFANIKQPKYGRNNWTGMEKNWLFFSNADRLYAIYGIKAIVQTTLELSEKGYVLRTHKTAAPVWKYGEIRGGCAPLPHPSGHLLRFFHSRTAEKGAIKWRYHIGALLMEDKAPFRVVKVLKEPILSGNEEWMLGVHHWKPNVVFPCGAVQIEGGYILTYGVNDCASRALRVPNTIL